MTEGHISLPSGSSVWTKDMDKAEQLQAQKLAELRLNKVKPECLCKFDAMCCPIHDPHGARD